MIQLGSILAIMWLYRTKIVDAVAGLATRPDSRNFALAVIVATIPALVAGALFSKYIKSVLYESPRVFAVAFIAGGIVMLIVERTRPAPTVVDAERTPLPRAFVVGLCQMLALIPGVSRSGATIVGGMAAGLDRPAAAEFSCFVAMPTMTAAFGKQLLDVRHSLSSDRAMEIGIGLVMAFVSSLLVVRPLLGFVRRSGFGPFAWYRIVLGVAILAALAADGCSSVTSARLSIQAISSVSPRTYYRAALPTHRAGVRGGGIVVAARKSRSKARCDQYYSADTLH
jgi:undecaprenyl-diphosphatase